MPPYLDTLIMKLTGLLRNGQKIVQEGALTAMASVADCAKSHFVNYYSQVNTTIFLIANIFCVVLRVFPSFTL